jgi:hypothetical protein
VNRLRILPVFSLRVGLPHQENLISPLSSCLPRAKSIAGRIIMISNKTPNFFILNPSCWISSITATIVSPVGEKINKNFPQCWGLRLFSMVMREKSIKLSFCYPVTNFFQSDGETPVLFLKRREK